VTLAGLALGVLGAVQLVALAWLFLYGLNAYILLVLRWWHRPRGPVAPPPPPAPWPAVTVQLPVFNERYVVRRLIDAVAALDYPRDRLEIQVLDDSTDETRELAAACVAEQRARGLDIAHLVRADRSGFKAGALAAGLGAARGELVVIFDADFVPSPDFLRQTVPHFADPAVAVVQGRWGHLNREFSLLTMAQSLGIDGHFAVEQAGRAWARLLLNFNGTAGVWRKAAILDAGGWAHDTLTEDLDLSYRAQLRGWRILYRPEIVCRAELPVLITGFKSQQRRWAKGSIQTARKLLPAVLRAPLSPWVKYQAAVHLTYYMIHPLMLATVLLSAPVLGLRDLVQDPVWLGALALTIGVSTCGPGTLLVCAQRVLYPDWRRSAWWLPTLMVIGVGVAWSTTLAVLGAFWGRDREFIRTPKFGIGPEGGHWRGRAYVGRRDWGSAVEVVLGLYCVWTTWLCWRQGSYGVLPFLALYATGFLAVGLLTMRHSVAGLGRRS
jgi:cellulose synthase/poly-beta-1,6-N-acetylglucosamine synthase-like glycosyltransferase